MSKSQSKRRMIENQAVFRKFNQRLQQDIDTANVIATEEGSEPITLDGDTPLFFYCECSDENCKKRIEMSPDTYNHIHQARDAFIILPGHEVSEIEEVTYASPDYYIVRKYQQPPENVDHLEATPINNLA